MRLAVRGHRRGDVLAPVRRLGARHDRAGGRRAARLRLFGRRRALARHRAPRAEVAARSTRPRCRRSAAAARRSSCAACAGSGMPNRRADRYELRLDYQVFLAPREVRTLEMPPLMLRFDGEPRAQEVRIDAWPVVGRAARPARRLAAPGPGRAAARPRAAADRHPRRAMAPGSAMPRSPLLAARLSGVGLSRRWPWWLQRHRPFAPRLAASCAACRHAARPTSVRAAIRRLHEALNQTAGAGAVRAGVDRVRRRAAALRAAAAASSRTFFARSRDEFFARDAEALRDAAWLVEFCRRCRDVERGRMSTATPSERPRSARAD